MAQVDRFMVTTTMGYPDRDGDLEVLERRADRQSDAGRRHLAAGPPTAVRGEPRPRDDRRPGLRRPDDVHAVVHPVLDHRIVLTTEVDVRNVDPHSIVEGALNSVPVPSMGD